MVTGSPRVGWAVIAERAAIYVLVAALGFVGYMIQDLRNAVLDPNRGIIATVAEIRTEQRVAIVPGLEEVKSDIMLVMGNLLNHPRFDKEDGQRLADRSEQARQALDEDHKRFMAELEKRLRALERESHERHNAPPKGR